MLYYIIFYIINYDEVFVVSKAVTLANKSDIWVFNVTTSVSSVDVFSFSSSNSFFNVVISVSSIDILSNSVVSNSIIRSSNSWFDALDFYCLFFFLSSK